MQAGMSGYAHPPPVRLRAAPLAPRLPLKEGVIGRKGEGSNTSGPRRPWKTRPVQRMWWHTPVHRASRASMGRTPESVPLRASVRRSLQTALPAERVTTGTAPEHPNQARPGSPITSHRRGTCTPSSDGGTTCVPMGVTPYPKGSAIARRASTPARFVRVDTPTYNLFPMRNTSPPSIVAGGDIVTRRRCRARTGSSNAGSPCRDGAPIEVTTASSSRIMALSSIKTLSGNASSGGRTSTATPIFRRARQYDSCCRNAR